MASGDDLPKDYSVYQSLPDDPEFAFATLQRRLYGQLQDMWNMDPEVNTRELEWRYVNQLFSFDAVHDLRLLSDYPDPPDNEDKFHAYFTKFRRHTESAATRIFMEMARREKLGVQDVVAIEPSMRAAIHRLIDAIKEKLNSAQLPNDKREALFNKLNSFAAEVDRDRTRTQAFYAFFTDLSRVVRDTSEPIIETAERILDILERARKFNDTLPPWEERKRIEGPNAETGKDLDDEIPF